MNRKERKEEEKRLLAELDEAVRRERGERDGGEGEGEAPLQSARCRRCRSVTKKGRCPVCGYTEYVPMDEGKRKKIRTVVTVVALGIFLVMFLILRLK